LKNLVLKVYENSLRIFFVFILVLASTSLLLSLIDFPKYEKYIFPIQWIKAKPVRLKDNLWIGSYMEERKLLEFLKRHKVNVVVIMLDRDMFHERALVKREMNFLIRKGFKVYFVQLKPFMETRRAIKDISRILKKYRRKGIYFHSYLGRIRTRIVRRILNVH